MQYFILDYALLVSNTFYRNVLLSPTELNSSSRLRFVGALSPHRLILAFDPRVSLYRLPSLHSCQPSCQIKWYFNEPCNLIQYNLQNLELKCISVFQLEPGQYNTALQILLRRILL